MQIQNRRHLRELKQYPLDRKAYTDSRLARMALREIFRELSRQQQQQATS